MDPVRSHARHTLAAMLALASLAFVAPADAATPQALGATAPTAAATLAGATLRDLSGRTYTLAELRGHVVVLNFWASWCAPCRKELPRLDALNTELAKGGGRVVAVSIDSDAGNARRFVTARALTLPVALDGPDGLARRLDLREVPATIVLDRDGSIACAVGGSSPEAMTQVVDTARRLNGHAPVATAGSETP